MGRTRIDVRIPEELLERADVAATVSQTTRTEIIVDALDEYLRRFQDEDDYMEAVDERFLDGEISFQTLKRFIGQQDAEAVRASKTLIDQGDFLTDDLVDRS